MLKSEAIIEAQWPTFTAAVEERLEAGKREYGDRSFDLDSPTLCEEIEQEILDINGWSFILWRRVRNLKKVLAEIESRAPLTPA